MQRNTTLEIPDQTGRVIVITGANSGLGLAAVRALAKRGATVVLGCRSAQNAAATRDDILRATPHARVEVGVVDVSSLASVRDFAEALQRRFTVLDVLINNAGIMATPHAISVDGFEMQFATNHLGHFALTGRLLPLLRDRRGSRIVAVSSIAARSGRISFDDPMGERRHDPWQAYNQSKLANLMFAFELQRRLAKSGAATTAIAAHPGASMTKLFASPGGFLTKRVISPLMNRLLFQPAERGVLPILLAAVSPAAQPGGYYGPSGFQEMKGEPAPARIPPPGAGRRRGGAALAAVGATDGRRVPLSTARAAQPPPCRCMIRECSYVNGVQYYRRGTHGPDPSPAPRPDPAGRPLRPPGLRARAAAARGRTGILRRAARTDRGAATPRGRHGRQ